MTREPSRHPRGAPDTSAAVDFNLPALNIEDGACWVVKRPLPVQVAFASADGVLRTLEGEVRYRAGDALLSGAHQDHWPVPRAQFDEDYRPVSAPAGCPGVYVKRSRPVLARQMPHAFRVSVAEGSDVLQGAAGDWLLDYGHGRRGVVKNDIFQATYSLVDDPRA